MAFYAMLLSFGFWIRAQKYSPLNPMRLAAAQEAYAGFAVREGDFEYKGKQFYRVNSDGFRVKLKEWHFDEDSGEFFPIKSRIGKNVIFDTAPYGKRFVKHAKDFWAQAGGYAIAATLGLASAIFGVLAFSWDGREAAGFYVFLSIAAILTGFAIKSLMPLVMKLNWNEIGPEPLPRAAAEFGHQQPHGAAADEGTI